MTRVTAVAVVLLLAASPAIARDPIARSDLSDVQRVQRTIKSVEGSVVTLEDGTTLMVPQSIVVPQEELRPGAMIVAQYDESSGQKVATSVKIMSARKLEQGKLGQG